MADGADATASRARRHQSHSRHDHRDRPRTPAIRRQGQFGGFLCRRDRDPCHRCAGPLARYPERGSLPRVRRFSLRDLRRVLLPRQGRRGRRRRQYSGRGGNLSDEPRAAGHSDPSPRRAQSRKDPAGEAVPQSEDRHHLGQRCRGNPGSARTAYGDRGAPAQHAHRQSVRPLLRRGLCRDRPYTGNRVRRGPAPTRR